MLTLRRRLASCALALLVCQTAAVFAAPLSSCCVARVSPAAERAAGEDKDCCPAGSHPPGQCPRHTGSNGASKVSCRMQCDSPHGIQFVAGAIGVMPPTVAPAIALSSDSFVTSFVVSPLYLVRVPHAPPPRVR
jgi:hypothetical protein